MKRRGSRRLSRSPFRRPLTVAGVSLLVYLIFMLLDGGMAANSDQILVDMFLCGGGLFFWLFFFAQFTLPLRTLEHRLSAFLRLLLYIPGLAGPVVRVENGDIKERKADKEKNGPGVVILDTASAAMVRNPAEFVGPVGPGVYFTRRFERLAGTIDLHLQKSAVGPKESDEPFAPQRGDEPDAEFQARQERRYSTQGVTRDGIEIAPRITVAVRLDVEQNQGATRFGYSNEAVNRVITATPVDANATPDSLPKKCDLTRLPLQLAADIWKECISRYTLSELFSAAPGEQTALQNIAREMRQRLTQSTYMGVDAVGRPVQEVMVSREYQLLQSRGVRLEGTTIPYLKFPPAIEDQIISMWKSTWLFRAQREREYIDQMRSYERERGRRSAVTTYASQVTQYLGAQNPDVRLDGENILCQLVRGTLYLVSQDSYLHTQATNEMQQLKELLEWCEKAPQP